jgi:hypothetical protein
MMIRDHFARKIPAYFDGTLTERERTELESFVGTNREFADYFKLKQTEYNNLKNSIPQFQFSAEAQTQMEGELKEVIDNLFHAESSNVIEKFSSWVKEKL